MKQECTNNATDISPRHSRNRAWTHTCVSLICREPYHPMVINRTQRTSMNRYVLPTVLAASLFVASNTTCAQTLYRCGKTFQDRPCAGGEAGQAISGAPSRQADTNPATDPICVLRAEQARKIAWAREAGRTEDDQLATAKSEQERLLIQEVYLLRGGSGEVATMVRDRCIKEREKATPATMDRASAGAVPSVGGSVAPSCVARGKQARKIAWAKEAGRSRSDQLASATTPDERLLVEEVYMTRGMSPEIVDAVVERCGKEHARQTMVVPSPVSPRESVPGSTPAAAASARGTRNADARSAASEKASTCRGLDEEAERIRDLQRRGGSASTMEALRQELRRKEDARFSSGC